uniref:Uncharacterized protein n=1 Tax=Anguilla anguilla TaxID=7936 RepID=A0A0E9QK70_ANGAN
MGILWHYGRPAAVVNFTCLIDQATQPPSSSPSSGSQGSQPEIFGCLFLSTFSLRRKP